MTQQSIAIVITQKTALIYIGQLIFSILATVYDVRKNQISPKPYFRVFIPGYWIYVIVWKNSIITLLKYISRKTGINQFSSVWWATESRPTTGIR